ncbi:uncharacterized protein LOC111380049, partial [Olea europaea var. sylvestris]|uniref:uncharacterized protein LOC111380049 n=1 Tax=Olea europaea var. sylvestris TaxID=158386 RepID=UPI000C1D1CBC
MSLNAFFVIIKQNQLVEDNYVDWKRNLMFGLIDEKLDFVLKEEYVLQQKLESLETSYDILESLKGVFGHQSRRAHFEAIHILQNICMKPGTPVKDHMLTMIAHFNVAENLGTTIDQETQVDMVLNSLSDMCSQFTVDYHLHKMNMPLTELMNELQN